MKNLLFLLHLPPPVHGSSMVGGYISESARIKSTFSSRFVNLLASKKIDDTGKVGLVKMFDFARIWFKLLVSLLKRKPDFCYLALTVTRSAFYRDVLLVALLKLFGVKRIYHLHNKGVKQWSENWVHCFFYRFVFKNADVVLLSQHLYSDIRDFVPESKVHICPNGIPEQVQHLHSAPQCSSPAKILFLSNLIQSKGVSILIEACSRLKSKGISFQCNFIGGEGDMTAEQFQSKVNQHNLADQVTYLGKKYDHEKYEAFVSADIFAFPTFYPNECFPLVLLEAMQYSLPVISTFEGGIPDVVEDGKTGFLVPQKDVASLASKLEFLIKNPEMRQQMGAAGREKYEKEFKLEIFENRLTEILQQIVGR